MESEVKIKPGTIDYNNFYYPPGGILLWLIIFLEIITFGMALVTLVIYSKNQPALFHSSRLLLSPTYGTINTIFLLSSGFFMAAASASFKQSNRKKTSLFLRLTMLGGLLFVLLKAFEYYDKIESGITLDTNIFFTFYWLLTAFHLIHVLVGLVILFSVYISINKNNSTATIEDVEASAAFWHMCDLIWLLLFPVLYLIF